jgi:hypothetical protein
VFRREMWLPSNCSLWHPHPQVKERPTIDHAANSVDRLHDIHNYVRQQPKLASDGWKFVTTHWPTARATTRVTECDSTAQPARSGNRPSCSPHVRAYTRQSLG